MSKFGEAVAEGQGTPRPVGEGKFGALFIDYGNGERGLLKARPFATGTFRGIPKQTMHLRERAAYILDHDILKFDVVPETLLTKWEGVPASVQKIVRLGLPPRDVVPGVFKRKFDDWKYRLAKLFLKVNVGEMLKVVVLDLVMNNVDRHGKNILIAGDRVWAIDNGLTFGRDFNRYRNVFHKYLFFSRMVLPKEMVRRLSKLTEADFAPLARYLSPEEVNDTWLRLQFVLTHLDRLSYRRVGALTQMEERAPFPTYEGWFKRQRQKSHADLALVYSPAVVVDGPRA